MRVLFFSLALSLLPFNAQANCEVEHTLCNTKCEVSHFSDKAANAGCQSKCTAKRAACETAEAADRVSEASKKAWDGTKSFVKGLTE